MPVPRLRTSARAVLAAGLVAAALSGCTTTTNGVGSPAGQLPGGPSATVPGPTGVNPGGPNQPAPTTPGGRPANCPASSCRLRLSASMDSPYGIGVWADDISHAAIVVLTNGGSPAASRVLPFETPAQLSCVSAGARSNCILVDATGAHSSVGHLVRHNGGALVLAASVLAETPTMQALDLNQDGWVDVAGLQNDGTPNYAAGRVYWQTWTSDGTRLRSSGCGPRSHAAGSAPSVPLTGSCP